MDFNSTAQEQNVTEGLCAQPNRFQFAVPRSTCGVTQTWRWASLHTIILRSSAVKLAAILAAYVRVSERFSFQLFKARNFPHQESRLPGSRLTRRPENKVAHFLLNLSSRIKMSNEFASKSYFCVFPSVSAPLTPPRSINSNRNLANCTTWLLLIFCILKCERFVVEVNESFRLTSSQRMLGMIKGLLHNNGSCRANNAHTLTQMLKNTIRRIFLLYNIWLNYINLRINEEYAEIFPKFVFFIASFHSWNQNSLPLLLFFAYFLMLQFFSCLQFFK